MSIHPTSNLNEPDFKHRFFQLSVVNILSNLMVPLSGLVDIAFLGHLAEIRHLAGVALATVLFSYIYWTFGFLRMGTTGTTAQAVGRSDPDAVLLAGLRNGLLALSLGLTIVILQHPLRELGFALLNATPEVKASGQAYYDALIWGAPATLLNFVLMGWFLGREQGGKVWLLSAIANGGNVVLDYLFMMQWGWESAGAGAATAASQYLMLLVGIILVRSEGWFSKVSRVSFRIFERDAMLANFKLNKDILVRTLALISTFAVFTNLSAGLGTLVLATNTLLLKVVSLAAHFIDGLAFATESFAGVFQGQNAKQKQAKLLQMSCSVSLGLGLTFATVFIVFPNPIFRLLTNHGNVIEGIQADVIWLIPVLGFGSIAYILDGYFLGLTEGRILRTSMLLSAIFGFAPWVIAAWQFRSNQMLWLGLSSFMAARTITLGLQVPKTLIENCD
jgi:MATE family multidrug resistance protein